MPMIQHILVCIHVSTLNGLYWQLTLDMTYVALVVEWLERWLVIFNAT